MSKTVFRAMRTRSGVKMPICMSVTLSEPVDGEPCRHLMIRKKGDHHYELEEVIEDGGRRFLLWYASATEHCIIGRDGHSVGISDDMRVNYCSCNGYAYNRVCKHLSAICALIADEQLPDPRIVCAEVTA